jgi:hypothetical protein
MPFADNRAVTPAWVRPFWAQMQEQTRYQQETAAALKAMARMEAIA